jgi:hypothetical protein
MLTIVAVVAIAAMVALFYFQPWNANGSPNHTTIINQQPANQQPAAAGAGNAGAAAGSGSTGTSGSSSSGSTSQ